MYYTEKQLIEFGQMILNRVTDNPDNAKTVTDADVANFKEGQPKRKIAYVDITGGVESYGVQHLSDVEMVGAASLLTFVSNQIIAAKVAKRRPKMQETKPQALTPDEAAEVMGKTTHTATFEATGEEAQKIAALSEPSEPFYFYLVTVTIQKRSGRIKVKGEEKYVDYKPFKIKGLIRTNAYSKVQPATNKFYELYLSQNDAYIKNYDIRKMDIDCLIPNI